MERVNLTPYFSKKVGTHIALRGPSHEETFEVIAVQHSDEACQSVVYLEVYIRCEYKGRAAVGISNATTARAVLEEARDQVEGG
jgi:hypothetical protein